MSNDNALRARRIGRVAFALAALSSLLYYGFPLLGVGLQNRVIDIFEAQRQFGVALGGWRFALDAVRETRATHFYAREGDRIETNGCVSARALDALRANP